MHKIIFPITLVLPAICPLISAKTIDLVVFPLTLVLVSLCPIVGPYSMLLTVRIIPHVRATIWPFRLALTTLNVVLPHTFVYSPVLARVDAVAIRFIVYKFALKNVAISVPERPLALRPVVNPITLVLSAINPDLDTVPMSYAAEIFSLWVTLLLRLELTSVNTAVWIHMFISVNQVIVFEQEVWI